MQDVVEHFSARTLFFSSPPTLHGPLAAPSCQSLSGQLTGSCRAFPATRAAGRRPSVALFDVPSPLILFTWTALCAHFLLNRSPTYFLVLCFPSNIDQFNPRHCRSSATNILGFSFSFPFLITYCFSTLKKCSVPAAVWMSAWWPGALALCCTNAIFSQRCLFGVVVCLACGAHFLLLCWKTAPKALIDQKDRNKMLQDEAGNYCESLCFNFKHKCVYD